MKKIIIALVASSLAIIPVVAEELVPTPQSSTVYELGKYNFSFENKQKEETVVPAVSETKIKETGITPVNTKTNTQKEVLTPITPETKTPVNELKPISTKTNIQINTQKEIIEQMKNDEAVKNIKNDTAEVKNATKQQVEKVYEQVDVTKNKTEKEVINNQIGRAHV